MKRYGYENRDVDNSRTAEAKALDLILKKIGEMTDRYKMTPKKPDAPVLNSISCMLMPSIRLGALHV